MNGLWRRQISLFINVFSFSVIDRKVRLLPSVVSNMSYSKSEEDRVSSVTPAERAGLNATP